MNRPGHLSREVIAVSADSFRRQYCPSGTGAVDFEVIIELDIGVIIDPWPQLKEKTGRVGCLSADGTTIYVDEEYQKLCPKDYMSLLLHEIGHRKFHLPLVPPGGFPSKKEWCSFHDGVSETLRSSLEWEAREFGMHVQMPTGELRVVFDGAVAQARHEFGSVLGHAARFSVHRRIAQWFGVTELRAEIRVRQQGLWRALRREERSQAGPILRIEPKQDGWTKRSAG